MIITISSIGNSSYFYHHNHHNILQRNIHNILQPTTIPEITQFPQALNCRAGHCKEHIWQPVPEHYKWELEGKSSHKADIWIGIHSRLTHWKGADLCTISALDGCVRVMRIFRGKGRKRSIGSGKCIDTSEMYFFIYSFILSFFLLFFSVIKDFTFYNMIIPSKR